MSLHSLSRPCHHLDGLVKFNDEVDDMSWYIIDIQKSPSNEPDADPNERLVLDA